jgi:apolipoprotein D and lipocalin family protein
LRLVQREEHMHQRMTQFTHEIDRLTRHRHLLLPLGGALLGVGAVALVRGRRRPGGVQLSKAVARSPGQGAGWVRLLGLGWPLMPASVRARVNPATASTLLAVGLPLIEGWLAQRRGLTAEAAAPLVTMPRVDLRRYAGRWYEVARLPSPFDHRCAGQPTTTYHALDPATDGADLAIVHRCRAPNGAWQETQGVARRVPGSGGARLKVQQLPDWLQWLGALPQAWADHWILHVDDRYSEALVGNPARTHLWVLSRETSPPPDRIQALIERARQQGYPVDRLVFADPE